MGKYYEYENNNTQYRVSFGVRIIANTLAILAAGSIISTMHVDGIIYAFLTGLVLSIVNTVIKPFIVLITLPITILTFGLFYPLVNVLLINFVDWLMGSHFEITGFVNILILTIIVALLNYAVTHIKVG